VRPSFGRFTPAGFSCGLSAPIIPIGTLPYECRAVAVRQRIIADQVCSSDPVVPIANDAGRAMPCAALAPLTRAELGRLQLISGCCIRKDAERTKSENRQEAKHGYVILLKRPQPRDQLGPLGFVSKSGVATRHDNPTDLKLFLRCRSRQKQGAGQAVGFFDDNFSGRQNEA
jgi:hypothetical protein